MKWLDVVGYEGLYQVSDTGLVRSLDRRCASGYGSTRRVPGNLLTGFPASGYIQVTLYNGGVRKKLLVHRLVLLTFRGPCPEGMEGCHGDGNTENNRLGNLRWDTKRGNWADRRNNGLGAQARSSSGKFTRVAA